MVDCSKQEMSIAEGQQSSIREVRGDNERETGEILRMGREVENSSPEYFEPSERLRCDTGASKRGTKCPSLGAVTSGTTFYASSWAACLWLATARDMLNSCPCTLAMPPL